MPGRTPSAGRLLWCGVLLFALCGLGAAKSRPSYEGTPEWGRLCELWNLLIDHSSGAISSAERLQQLTPQMDRADTDLTALSDQKRLPPEVAEELRRLVHARFIYLSTQFYPHTSRSERGGYEAAQLTSQWVVELGLSLLRDQLRLPDPDRTVLQGSQDALLSELTFQHQCTALDADLAARRKTLADKEKRGGKVDWKPLDDDASRRQYALVDLYKHGRRTADRPSRQLLPYLLSLTRPCPSPPSEGDGL